MIHVREPRLIPIILARATFVQDTFASRGTMCPGVWIEFAPRKTGRREDRVRALHPRSRVPMHKSKNAHEHTGSAEAVRTSLRNGFTAYFVLSPARLGLFATVAPRKRELLKSLTPAIGASGPHDFAVRITRCSSKAHPRPPLPAPTSVTMANAPLSGRDARNYAGDLGQKQRRWPGGCHDAGTVIHYQHIPRLSPLV
jgi:hypothetical protein